MAETRTPTRRAASPIESSFLLPGASVAGSLAAGVAAALFMGLLAALLAFWATRADALLAVQDALIFLLAGQVAPVVLLPGILQSLAIVLPFRYMIGFPIELLLGQLNPAQMLTGFAYQIAWFVVAAGLSLLIWRVGVRHYTAIGG